VEDEKARLIQQLDESHTKMQAELTDVDTELEIYPGWTIKQILAHIVGWDEAATAALRAHAGGQEVGAVAAAGIDFYNDRSVTTREFLTYDQTVREWGLAREQFKAAIRELSPDKLSAPMLFPWGETGAVEFLVRIFEHHETRHAEEVRKAK